MPEEEKALEGEISATPAPEDAVQEQQTDGNLSMAAYADQLLKRREQSEEEPEATEEAPEAADPSVAEEDPLAEAMQEEAPDEPDPPAEEPEPEQTQSKPAIDLDSLTEDETTALAKQLSATAVQRFGKLTAQKTALAEQNLALQQQMEQQQTATANEAPAFLRENALSNVVTDEQLLKEAENLNSLVEWAEESAENEVEYDDEGNEYVAKDGDRTYTKSDLRRIKNNARRILRKDVPARQAWIKERLASDQQAVQTFGFLSAPESEDMALFLQAKESPMYKPLVDHLPNSNYALGLMVKGLRQVQKEQAAAEAKGKPKAKKPKAPTANAEAAGAPRTPKGEVKGKKALAAAKAKFDASGAMADYNQYLQLKRAAA